MNSIVGKIRKLIGKSYTGAAPVAVQPAVGVGFWVDSFLIGAILGVIAQFLRQAPGALMDLGASTSPWVNAGFLLSVFASRGAHTLRKAILVSAGTVAAYLYAWLVSYHLLFMLRESISLAAGWREAAPWLVAALPASLVLGTVAAVSHKHGLLGDLCLAAPFAWSLPEVTQALKTDWLTGVTLVIPIAVLIALLIHMVKEERPLGKVAVLATALTLGIMGIALYPVARSLIPSW